MYDDKYSYINKLVNNAKNGDSDSLFELFDFYKPLIFSSIKRCLQKNDKLSAYKEDIISDSIFVFSKLVDQYNPELTYFSYFISIRLDINLFRYIQNKYDNLEVSLENEPKSDSIFDPFNKIDNMIVIHETLRKLPENMRDILVMYFFDMMDQKECALRLNISQSAFSKRLSKALSMMKKELGDDFLFN